MRRMKEMSKFQAGMGFYGQMPDSYNIVLNSDHPLVKKVLDDSEAATAEALKPIVAELKGRSLIFSENNQRPVPLCPFSLFVHAQKARTGRTRLLPFLPPTSQRKP